MPMSSNLVASRCISGRRGPARPEAEVFAHPSRDLSACPRHRPRRFIGGDHFCAAMERAITQQPADRGGINVVGPRYIRLRLASGEALHDARALRCLLPLPATYRSWGPKGQPLVESPGTIFLSSSSLFALSSGERIVKPVMFPPGCERLVTSPAPSISSVVATMGIVRVACCAIFGARSPAVQMTQQAPQGVGDLPGHSAVR
jgi:hypothetical protein